MYILNITISIDPSVEQPWLEYLRNFFIKGTLETKLIQKIALIEVLVDEEMGGKTYTIQLHFTSKEILKEYEDNHLGYFLKRGTAKFGHKMLTFATELKLLEEFKP